MILTAPAVPAPNCAQSSVSRSPFGTVVTRVGHRAPASGRRGEADRFCCVSIVEPWEHQDAYALDFDTHVGLANCLTVVLLGRDDRLT